MTQSIQLCIIDPQVDFCTKKGGKLYVPGAEDDINRLAKFVKRLGAKLDDIHITLDSHHLIHIAHPIFWKDTKGKHPDPFTLITTNDVDHGIWTTTSPGLYHHSREYVHKLEKNGRYVLCIWPPHCLIGTPGHCIQEPLLSALLQWEEENFAFVNKITKGSNYLTEHYSAVMADVPQDNDPSTQLNTDLIKILEESDQILFAGEAATHCLLNTMRDIINNFNDPATVKKIVLLTDGTSCINGFEDNYNNFVKDMQQKGMQTITTTDYLK